MFYLYIPLRRTYLLNEVVMDITQHTHQLCQWQPMKWKVLCQNCLTNMMQVLSETQSKWKLGHWDLSKVGIQTIPLFYIIFVKFGSSLISDLIVLFLLGFSVGKGLTSQIFLLYIMAAVWHFKFDMIRATLKCSRVKIGWN